MKTIFLECPEGKYISDMKNFGFLYNIDKRTRESSHGYILCHEAMHSEDPPLSSKTQKTTDDITLHEETIAENYYLLQ